MRSAIAIAFVCLLAAEARPQIARSQDATPQEQAIADFRRLALKKVNGSAEMRARGDALGAWLEKHQTLDLGAWEFAKAVAAYFTRDYEVAGKELLAYLEKHGKLPTKDFDTICGRVLLNHAVLAFRAEDYDRGRRSLSLSLDYYATPQTIYAMVGRVLGDQGDEKARRIVLDITSRLLHDDRLSSGQKIEALKRMYAAPRRAAGAAGGGRPPRPTAIAPFTATDMDGKRFSLADYRGKVVLVDFWATWCGPCMREMPHVVRAYEKHRADGFEIIGISLDKENAEKKIRDTMRKAGMTWRQVYDGKGWNAELAKKNNISSIPATFLFDHTGKCRAANLRGAALEREIEKLLKEAAGG